MVALVSVVSVVLSAWVGSAWVGMIVHELSHAFAARLLRVPLAAVQFGAGRVWARWRWGNVEWRVARWLSGGHVETLPPRGRARRWRCILMVAAGPAADIALAILFSTWAWRQFNELENGGSASLMRLTAGFAAGLWLAFFDSLFRRPGEKDEGPTDLQIIHRLWSQPVAHADYTAALARALDEIQRRTGRSTLETADWELLAGDPLLDELDAATIALMERFPQGDPRRLDRIDPLCTRALFSGDREAIRRALAWSQELHEARPNEWTTAGTCGSLLLVNGRRDEGAALLEKMMAHHEAPLDRAIGACCLTWAAHCRGELETRERWWREALRHGAGRPAIPWMAREMSLTTAVPPAETG